MIQLFLFSLIARSNNLKWGEIWGGGGGGRGGSSTELPAYMYHKNLGGGQEIFFFLFVIKLLGTMTGCKLNSLMLKLP